MNNETADHIDNGLFRRMQQGDTAAFTSLYESYNKMLYVLAFRYLQDRAMAEDAVQQIFTRLWESHSELRVAFNVRNYLFTMMKNHVLNTIRNENNAIEKNYQIAYSQPEYDDSLLERIEEKELRNLLNKAIAQLPEQKRMICLMKMEGKLSNQEIADKMAISVNTVKTHYSQAIKILRAKLYSLLTIVIAVILFTCMSVDWMLG